MNESGVKDFVIPLDKDELLNSRAGVYYVKDIVPPGGLLQALKAAQIACNQNGPQSILNHFDTFFSVIVHGSKVHFSQTMRAFDLILQATAKIIDEMESLFERGMEVSNEDRPTYLCANKMYAYLLSSLSCYIEDYTFKNSTDRDNIGKKKKTTQRSDAEEEWDIGKQKALECIYRWFQLPLHKLWTPPIVEDLFITVLTQFCYKVLEQSKDPKQKHLRETIFEILGTLIKRYNQGIYCVVRIIQLVKLCDTLAAPLAAGVVHMVETTGCISFIKETVCEIGQSEPGETDARNISVFLETVATSRPDLILPILDDITEHLANEHYAMRNCVLGVLGAVVLGALTGENLEEEKREKRDDCLHNLEEHMLDSNAYVRSKALQIWQRLCCQGAVPLQRQCSLLKATCLRLEDKSATVRKQALQLLRALLQGNPFAAKLDQTSFAKQLEEANVKLKELKIAVASLSTRGDHDRIELWNALLPDIRKAITVTLAKDSDKNDRSSDDDSEESDERNKIDPDVAFEKVRQLLLAEKVFEAVAYLKKICDKLPDAPQMSDLSIESKEDCFFLFLLKIFVESEGPKDAETNPATDSTHPSNAEKSTGDKDLKRLKEELKAQRRVVKYLTNCLDFAKQLENAIPVAESLLFSTMAGDAVEACTFLGTACQFGVTNARSSIQKALSQVLSRDQSVRNNVASIYKEIYLETGEPNQLTRQKALNSVNGLIELLKGLKPGQSSALSQLIVTWQKNGDVGAQEVQIMWEKFSMKIPETRAEESRAALVLLTMAANSEPSFFTHGNLDVLITVGLGPRAREDLLLARDTCRALLKVKNTSSDSEKPPAKYPNEHEMFQKIVALVQDYFTSTKDDGYVSFVTDAINAIYHLANKPDVLMKSILLDITSKSNLLNDPKNPESESRDARANQTNGPNAHLLSRLLYIVGHVAIRQMVHLDNGVYKELKRRNAVRELKKARKVLQTSRSGSGRSNPAATPSTSIVRQVPTPSSARQTMRNKEKANSTINENNGEEVLEGASADDADAEFVIAALENDIVNGNGILAKFVPLVLDVCRHPEKYNDERLQAWGVLALSKMMTVSSSFCVESLQLLVTIMERSPYPGIRANVVVGLCDLITRFPNQVEPWTSHIYGRLRDDNVKVRSTCVKMLSTLIMREMIRVKGQVSGLALSMIDSDEQIRADTKLFFKELSNKGNALYNVMPDILSRLTDPDLNLAENDFQEILKYILGLMQKERQIDTVIDKLCSRFILATTERQWRDLSYCLSLLQFSAKSIRRLMESLPLLKDKIHHKLVLKSLQTIIEQTKKKAEAKAACIELEEKIEDLLKTTEEPKGPISDREAMPPPPVPKSRKKSRRPQSRRSSSSSDNSSTSSSSGEDDEEDEEVDRGNRKNVLVNGKRTPAKSRGKPQNGGSLRVVRSSSESDDEEEPVVRKTPKKVTTTPKKRKRPVDQVASTPTRTKRNRQSAAATPETPTSQSTTRRSSARLSKSASKRH